MNNKRGKELLKNFGDNIQKEIVDIRHVMQINKQLQEPAKYTKMRKKYFLHTQRRVIQQLRKCLKYNGV